MKWLLFSILGWSFAEVTLGWTYHYSIDTMNWTDARKWCQTKFTDLVVIQNDEENAYITSILPNRESTPYYWIGITKKHLNESWSWVGHDSTYNSSWAENEPNNNKITEFCVEMYVNSGQNRGKWNDENCAKEKYAVCYKAQCNQTSCVNGVCLETINNTTCLCYPDYEGDKCQKALKCPPLSQPANGGHSCSNESQIFNSTCHFKCNLGFLMIGSSTVTCAVNGNWKGPRPVCESYKKALLAVAGCAVFSSLICICFCCMNYRRRKKPAQERSMLKQPEDEPSPFNDAN